MRTHWKGIARALFILLIFGLMTFGMVRSARAADFRKGDTVVIGQDEVIDDDLFIAGTRVEMNGTVKGDLIIVGSEIAVNGKVEGSLLVAGYALRLNGGVSGSLYGGGYSLSLEPDAKVGRNLYFGGFSLITEGGSSIGRGLYAADYQTLHEGRVQTDILINSAALEINGEVGGDVKGEVGKGQPRSVVPALPGIGKVVMPGLNVGDEAEISGKVDVRVTEYTPPTAVRLDNVIARLLGRAIAQRVGEFIALLIVGGLLLRFWPEVMRRVRSEAQSRPLQSAGWGCVGTLAFYIGVPIAAGVIFLVALMGGVFTFGELFNDIFGLGSAALGLIMAAFFFTISLGTKVLVSFLGGRLIIERLSSNLKEGFWTDFAALALADWLHRLDHRPGRHLLHLAQTVHAIEAEEDQGIGIRNRLGLCQKVEQPITT